MPTLESAVVPDAPSQAAVSDVETAIAGAVHDPGISSAAGALNAGRALVSSPAGVALQDDIPVLIQEAKAGYKTTEFWAALAAVVGDVISSIPQTDKLLFSGLAAVYALARGLAKNGTPNQTPVLPD